MTPEKRIAGAFKLIAESYDAMAKVIENDPQETARHNRLRSESERVSELADKISA